MTSFYDARVRRLAEFLRSTSIPQSYLSNSPTEEHLLSFVDDFEVLYHKYFPDRKKLLLTPINECNCRKMICTFVRPTALQYDEMFDLEKCSEYIAGYMKYEPLYDPQMYEDSGNDVVERVPTHVASPTTSFGWQTGNCLEMSLVLVSLLCGAGYNAYVVVGYANRSVCLNDQSQHTWQDTLPEEVNSDDEQEPVEEIDPEYATLMRERPFLRGVNDPDPHLSITKGSTALADVDVNGTPFNNQSGFVSPAHCWVLVLPGSRKTIKMATFIESSTGQLISYATADKFYLGIESVFNSRQYYVNLQPDALVSAVASDLTDVSQWESIFPAPCGDEDSSTATTTMHVAPRRALGEMGQPTAGNLHNSSAKMSVTIPLSWASEVTLNRSQFASRYPNSCKTIIYSDAVVHLYAEYSQPDLRIKEIILADSVNVDQEQVHVFYKHRADKLRRRSVYPTVSTEMKDNAGGSRAPHSIIITAPSYRLLQEWYEKGRMRNASVEGLRQFIHEPGVHRTMRFYWRARQDGLTQRTDIFYDMSSLRKIKDYYKGRPDKLCYRSATFGRPKTMRESNIHKAVVIAGNGTIQKENPRLEPIRLSQKFVRNPNVSFDKDVAKTTFLRPPAPAHGSTPPGEMWVFFHFDDGSIVRPYRMYAKPSSNVEDYIAASASRKPTEAPKKVVTMPGAEPPTDLELYNERKWLSGVETTCLSDLRSRLDEHVDILVAMERDHSIVQQILSSYDTLRNRPKETEAELAQQLAEAARRTESRKDYLAPYIAKLEMPPDFDGNYLNVNLTVEQAKQVRDEALLELKERLIQRGHIMQNRMDKEKEDFSRRQIAYQKVSDSVAIDGGKEAEEFALYCKEATWRMKVLDERLAKHIDHASDKYADLAKRLSEDRRLAALY